MKSAGGKMFGLDLTVVLTIVALGLIIFVLYHDAKDDKTASEVAVEKIQELRGEVHSRAGELDELQIAHDRLEHIVKNNGEATLSMDQRLTAELNAMKLKLEALEVAVKAKKADSAKILIDPIKVEPVQVKVAILYPKMRPEARKKVDLEPVRRKVKKITGGR